MFSFFRRKKNPNPSAAEQQPNDNAAMPSADVSIDAQTANAPTETASEASQNSENLAANLVEPTTASAANVTETAETASAASEAETLQRSEFAENVVVEQSTEFAATEVAETETNEQPQTFEQAQSDAFIASEAPVETPAENVAEATAQTAEPQTASAVAPAVAAVNPESEKLGWAARLKKGLSKSRDQMAKSLAGVFGGGQIDEDLYEELETVLLTSDMGIEATEHLMKEVRARVSLRGLKDGAELRAALKEAVYDLLKPLENPLVLPDNGQPFVIMMAGINGAGKTTSIGKLAKYFQAQGKSVILAAGDTFRAAAREQLQEWGKRNDVTVISQEKGDSAAVCFDAVEAAKARKIDVVLADTAGRLPTQLHLMEEIKKVKRVLQKAMPDAPHEIIVVLDANIGQNAVNQVKAFDDALGVTGLIVTKLDGTAKGGVLAALASSRPIPVRYIGVGESIDDLRPFDARAFVDALIDG
ncbi:MAG: signal recognition particle-docking protein FtsY [Neisseria sp.]|nr:signal recognition particle-docking protein FtsY [Neisseria sp.]